MVTPDERCRVGSNERKGFTLVELIVALFVLTVGLLGLAASTAWLLRLTMFAGAVTDRTAVRQQVVESIRARPLDDIAAGSRTMGRFTVTWTVTETTDDFRTIEVVTDGPGLKSHGAGLPTMDRTVADTFYFQKIDLRP